MSLYAGGTQHPPIHPHFNHPPHYSQNRGSPPMKKSKGNPIITRYPPPPGYRPPIPPPTQFQQTNWQQQAQAPRYGYSPYSGYQSPAYGQTQLQQSSQGQFMGCQPQQFPAGVYPPPQAVYPPAAQVGWQGQIASHQGAPHFQRHQQPVSFEHDPHRRGSAPFPPHYPPANHDDNIDPYPPQFSPDSPEDDDDDEEQGFEQACYFARHPEQINPRLSLGLIEWKAPLPTRRPLPSTFADAELEALAPRVPKASDDESISEYFIKSRREESLCDVRMSETWSEIKDDLIFQEFSRACPNILSRYELLSQYRDRFDPEWAAGERMSPTPELSRQSTPAFERVRSDSMDVKHDQDHSKNNISKSDSESRILDGLEQALGSPNESDMAIDQRSTHSRSTSVTSQSLPRFKRPKPLPLLRDQAQENILAALGVTGSPKMVYETPGPAFGPPPEPKAGQNNQSDSTKRGYAGSQGQQTHPLPAPPFLKRGRSPSFDPWKNGQQQGNGHPHERRSSAASGRTASGSDFGGTNDHDSTPRARMERQDSRKRGYADSDIDSMEDHGRLGDDVTPKQRRKQARVGRA